MHTHIGTHIPVRTHTQPPTHGKSFLSVPSLYILSVPIIARLYRTSTTLLFVPILLSLLLRLPSHLACLLL